MTRCYCRVAIVFCFFALVGGLTGMAEAIELRRLYFGFARRSFRVLGDQGCRIF